MRTFAAAVLLAGAGGAAVVVAPARAHAAPCGVPDLVDMVPPDGATAVPLNATLSAHYMASADYLGEDVVLVHPDGREQVLDARFDPTEVLLSVTPTEPLVRGRRLRRALAGAARAERRDARATATRRISRPVRPTTQHRRASRASPDCAGTSSASRTTARTSSRSATSSTSRWATPATTAAATG